MALSLPEWLAPVLEAYEIPWPDIDEDAFHELKQPLRNFGKDLKGFASALQSALQQLESANPSSTLRALLPYFERIRADFLDPISTLSEDLAGTPCDVGYDLVVGVKVACIIALGEDVVNTIGDIVSDIATLGTDAALSTAEGLAVRQLASDTLHAAEDEAISQLAAVASGYIDRWVSDTVNPFIQNVETRLQSEINAYMPTFVLDAAELEDRAAQDLRLSPSELGQCINSISESTAHLVLAAQTLDAAVIEIFSQPAPSPRVSSLSSTFRYLVREAVRTIGEDLSSAAGELVDHVASHFVTLLEDFQSAVADVDAQARAAASKPLPLSGAPVAVGVATAVGATATVTSISGQVDATEVEEVQVEEATAIAAAEDLILTGAAADVSIASAGGAGGGVNELRVDVQKPPVEVGVASADARPIDPMRSRVDAGGEPHLQATQEKPTSVPDLQGRPRGEHRTAFDRPDVNPARGPERLQVKRPEEHHVTAGAAEEPATRVADLRLPNEGANREQVPPTPQSAEEVEGP